MPEFGGQSTRTVCSLWASLGQALQEYNVVDVRAGKSVQPGDFVIWRWNKPENPKARDGHVVMYLEAVDGKGDEFLGIEANRTDDKSKEGIVIDHFNLK